MNRIINIIKNFLPMIIIYLIATYSPEVARISHTVLGKLTAVALIILYTFFDAISGLLVCALVIFYYQTDYVEGFDNKDVVITEEDVVVVGVLPKEDPVESDKDSHKEKSLPIIAGEPAGENLEDAYPLSPTIGVVSDKAVSEFRQKHCVNGNLMHKGENVKPEAAELVFPEVKMDDFHKCNICDPSCRFDIKDNLIKAEENLVKPKSSNDFFEIVWRNIQISSPVQ
jgi:uncharacterized membrane protein YobD (UPF0266 family)